MLKKSWWMFFVVLMFSPSLIFGQEIQILFTGGSKGYLDPEKGKGGMAQKVFLMKELVQKGKQKGALVLPFDSGNTIAPYYLSRFDKGKTILRAMKNAGYQGMTPGEDEFSYGQAYFLSLVNGNPPFLAANLYQGKKRIGREFLIFQHKGVKVGVFGLISPTIQEEVSGDILKGLAIKNPAKEAKQVVKDLKAQKVQVIICIGFLNVDEALKVAEENPEINLLVRNYRKNMNSGGETVIQFPNRQKKGVIVAPEKWNYSIGLASLIISKGLVKEIRISYHPVDSKGKKDGDTEKAILDLKKRLAKKMNLSLLPFSPSEAFPVEFTPKGFAKIFAAVLREVLDTEVGIININLLNGKEISKLSQKQTMSYLDLERILKARAQIAVVAMKGADLAAVLGKENPDEPIAVSGAEKKDGKILVNGVPIRDGDIYWVATVKFLASGNTGYPAFQKKQKTIDRFLLNRDFSLQSSPKGIALGISDAFTAYAQKVLRQIGRNPYGAFFKSRLVETMDYEPPTYLFIFDNLRLTYSATKVSASSQLANTIPDSRAAAKDEETIALRGRLILIRYTRGWLFENRLGFAFGQTKLEGQPLNVSEDDLYLESDSTFLDFGFNMLSFKMVPYLGLKYDTEFKKASGVPLEKILYFSTGVAGVSPGPFTKIKVGALGKADFTGNKNTVQYGLLGQIEFHRSFFDAFTVDSNALLYYFPDQSQDKVGDLKVRFEWNTILKMPFWREFFLIIEFRFFAFQGKKVTSKFGTHSAISVGISYNKIWKFIYEPFFGRE
ncbi:MAG: bifunctional metallophosphatase/5'-nucleotidase [Planctomycetota bacterium]|nr:MAG: bifunctional metallophosphatase/5'-nucleotidase [Planctomycetota bacterium]